MYVYTRTYTCVCYFTQVEMAEELTNIVNWAYRGKSGQQGWTGEMEFIDGIRISLDDMKKLLAGNDALVLVARHGDRFCFFLSHTLSLFRFLSPS
jgi:hypothetical protein